MWAPIVQVPALHRAWLRVSSTQHTGADAEATAFKRAHVSQREHVGAAQRSTSHNRAFPQVVFTHHTYHGHCHAERTENADAERGRRHAPWHVCTDKCQEHDQAHPHATAGCWGDMPRSTTPVHTGTRRYRAPQRHDPLQRHHTRAFAGHGMSPRAQRYVAK